mmetsp:Transcript_2925/g.7473  ORF Transcript_2925/g.7473 Transcript_2925/m.7473 type:complete len:225 (-) Transcript_2925:1228-1902(-)
MAEASCNRSLIWLQARKADPSDDTKELSTVIRAALKTTMPPLGGRLEHVEKGQNQKLNGREKIIDSFRLVAILFSGGSIAIAGGTIKQGDQGTTTIFMRFECPGHSSFVPCTATTWSPESTRPSALAFAMAFWMTASVPTKDWVSMGMTPRATRRCRCVDSLAVMAKICAFGRYLAKSNAVEPDSVNATMSLHFASMAHFTADEQTASTGVMPCFSAVRKRIER